ncbi:esterase-like activity of phytase family protein [Roseibium sediminicola]|uniref:Esterase-like activity of phytase family protein n=1 Tax=Roseibium sediminicola TaxID=2933272 RepID=A0ABT0GSH2_9HYPH|nr:esterase-like activity of phytase family protein [Roseibium sp. CAU 1639]MCK7612391.1 esterase-like activity of phytase family protein [Roseibium sp. CAU 1639]
MTAPGSRSGFSNWLLAAGGAALMSCLILPAVALELLAEGEAVRTRTKPIETFHIGQDETRFGKLTFLGGLEILASDRKVGGLSGLISLDRGEGILAVTDNGHWVVGRVEQTADGKPLDLSDVRFAPLLGADGKTLNARWGHDTEALTLDGSGLYVTAETRNAVYHYPWPLTTGHERMIGEVALPEDIRALPRNAGLESLAAAPEDSPFSGNLIAIAESAPSDLHDLTGFVLGPGGTERFTLRRHDRFDATDAAFLPNGDLLVMERRFNLRDLIGMRLRRISAAELKADALIEGELLLEADFNTQIDNMEGLAVHQSETGDTILTLVSDDNRSILQRTLFLRFRLEE